MEDKFARRLFPQVFVPQNNSQFVWLANAIPCEYCLSCRVELPQALCLNLCSPPHIGLTLVSAPKYLPRSNHTRWKYTLFRRSSGFSFFLFHLRTAAIALILFAFKILQVKTKLPLLNEINSYNINLIYASNFLSFSWSKMQLHLVGAVATSKHGTCVEKTGASVLG